MPGTLYLLPCALGEHLPEQHIAPSTREALLTLQYFVVEDARSARRFLANLGRASIRDIVMHELNEHTPSIQLPELLQPMMAGHNMGLMSEAGCPAIADPGANLVALAHREGIRVVPMVGPSAILLALMASGLGGQRFDFHGYLPVESSARRQTLLDLERQSALSQATQLFIETPYRNEKLLADILAVCAPSTLVSIAADLTQPNELIATRAVREWRQQTPELNRRPTVFGLLSQTASSKR